MCRGNVATRPTVSPWYYTSATVRRGGGSQNGIAEGGNGTAREGVDARAEVMLTEVAEGRGNVQRRIFFFVNYV